MGKPINEKFRKIEMKKLNYYILLAVVLLATSCTDNTTDTNRQETTEFFQELAEMMGYESHEEHMNAVAKKIADSALHPYAEETTLLSVKYKIDRERVEDLLEELFALDHSILNEDITIFSTKYGISPEKITSLLIDFYSMQRDEESLTWYAKEKTLLSVKYKIDRERVEDLLEELFTLDHSIRNEDITVFSTKYDIPSEKITSLLIDFFSMQRDKGSMIYYKRKNNKDTVEEPEGTSLLNE